MASVYQLAMGQDFALLQPELQEYFSLASDSGPAAAGGDAVGLGTGIFDVAGCPRPALRPLLRLAGRDNALFPEYERDVPFSIENRAHPDADGRPALTAVRTIDFEGVRRTMQDTTVWEDRAGLTDVLGRSGAVRTDLACAAGADGRMRLVSRRTSIGAGRFRLGLPMLLEAAAFTEQWWDRSEGRFRIRTKVLQRQMGTILEYQGSFSYRLVRS
ncbi:DUF4166 domain-containing protein [Arthrobacter crystallopoietes]|uniref:DUF4166 domain-containing protein n=1 Tax=Crystallibacter crystallopoietes TaxID=37928 RepID=UPI0011114A1B|nr:DUF4166 domain-containing protein [Arthrobacter crystallopoietes]QTG80651.1 DUF4166 domain-containing protein [Arthrobacter crystallopoietes]